MPSKTILDCDKTLQRCWHALLTDIKRRNLDHYHLQIIHTHIAPEEQLELWRIGRNGMGELTGDGNHTVTDFDGTDKSTLFNEYPSQAIRFRILDSKGDEKWPQVLYQSIHEVCARHNVGFTAPDVIHRI